MQACTDSSTTAPATHTCVVSAMGSDTSAVTWLPPCSRPEKAFPRASNTWFCVEMLIVSSRGKQMPQLPHTLDVHTSES